MPCKQLTLRKPYISYCFILKICLNLINLKQNITFLICKTFEIIFSTDLQVIKNDKSVNLCLIAFRQTQL
jgi:hypothetical protein